MKKLKVSSYLDVDILSQVLNFLLNEIQKCKKTKTIEGGISERHGKFHPLTEKAFSKKFFL
jgi:hypothetical protein